MNFTNPSYNPIAPYTLTYVALAASSLLPASLRSARASPTHPWLSAVAACPSRGQRWMCLGTNARLPLWWRPASCHCPSPVVVPGTCIIQEDGDIYTCERCTVSPTLQVTLDLTLEKMTLNLSVEPQAAALVYNTLILP